MLLIRSLLQNTLCVAVRQGILSPNADCQTHLWVERAGAGRASVQTQASSRVPPFIMSTLNRSPPLQCSMICSKQTRPHCSTGRPQVA